MSISDKFSRSWEITKKTFTVMKKDKEILLFPILSSIFSVVLFLVFFLPFLLSLETKESPGGIGFVGVFIFYFLVTFAAVFFNAGVVHITKTRFEGGDATFSDGIKVGLKHLKQIVAWSLLSATVGLILNILERQSRGGTGIFARVAIRLVGAAWAIVSLFVVPAIVLKGYGPVKALKSSARAVKKTWGEALIKYYGLGIARMAFILAGVFFLFLPGIGLGFGLELFGVGLVLVGIFIVYLVLVLIIFSSANTVFNTALFMYADTGKIPEFYTKEELGHAFVKKKR